MTDTPNKIEEIRKALEEHHKYWDEKGVWIGGALESTPLEELAEDMARIVLATEKLAGHIETWKATGMTPKLAAQIDAALGGYIAAVEGDQ